MGKAFDKVGPSEPTVQPVVSTSSDDEGKEKALSNSRTHSLRLRPGT